MMSLQADLENPYAGYHVFWQWMGFLYPIVGLVLFAVPLVVCTTEEPFDHDVDQAFDEMALGVKNDSDKQTPRID